MTPEQYKQIGRVVVLLAPFVEVGDADLSDSELLYRLKKRFDLDWNRRQALVDPSE